MAERGSGPACPAPACLAMCAALRGGHRSPPIDKRCEGSPKIVRSVQAIEGVGNDPVPRSETLARPAGDRDRRRGAGTGRLDAADPLAEPSGPALPRHGRGDRTRARAALRWQSDVVVLLERNVGMGRRSLVAALPRAQPTAAGGPRGG